MLSALQDLDDEVREEARSAVAMSLDALLCGPCGALARAALPSVLAAVEQAWKTLPPPVPLCSPREALHFVAETAERGSSTTVLSEGSALVVGHTILLLFAATAALSATSVADLFCDIVASEARSHVPAFAPSPLPSPDVMLARPLFTPDEANDYVEGVVAAFLAASHCFALVSLATSATLESGAAVSALVASRLSPMKRSDATALLAAAATGGPVEGYIDDKNAWLGGETLHPSRARAVYGAAALNAVLRACAAPEADSS